MTRDASAPAGADEDLVRLAERTPLARAPVAALAEALRGRDPAGAIDRALKLAPDAAVALMLAAAEAGRPPRPAEIARAVRRVIDAHAITMLLGACAAAERTSLLLDLAADESVPGDVRGIAVFLATESVADAPSERLLVAVRLLSRSANAVPLAKGSEMLLALAADRLDDAAVKVVAGWLLPLARSPEAQELGRRVLDTFRGPPSRVLPERPFPRVEPAYFPIRQAAPKVGRNDPCPCGSGRKFKKCCEGREGGGAPASAGSGAEGAATSGRPIGALAHLERASTEQALRVFRELSDGRRFEDAERALEILAAREDLPSPIDGYRAELINCALRATARDVVHRQVALLESRDVADRFRLDLALLDQGGACPVETVEREALRVLRDPDGDQEHDLAYALLERVPALGILVARGFLDPDRWLEAEALIDAIEEARDRLLLPPGDPAAEHFDRLRDAWFDEGDYDPDDQPDAHAEDEVAAVRADLARAVARVRDLERELKERDAALREARAAAEARRRPADAASVDAETVRRLRAKLDEFQARIDEGNAERRELRRRLADLERAAAPEARSPEPDEEDDDEGEGDAPAPAAGVLLPAFAPRFRDDIAAEPADVARRAITRAAALAAGDPAAWRAVKRLQAARELWSARIGIHHRLLFRIAPEGKTLEVLALVQRRDLLGAIRGLRVG